MSTYQMVMSTVYRGIRPPSGLAARFWKWWIGLYAEPPRKLPPMV